MASSLVWIYLYSPQLGIQLKKMCKSLDCWSIDMLNFDFLEKNLGIVSPSYFVFDFSRKMFHVTGFDKFNICVHWFSCTWNGSARTFVHAKLHVHKTVMVDANLHHLQFANCHRFIVSSFVTHIFCFQLTLKISVEDMLNTKGLVTLTEYQQVN